MSRCELEKMNCNELHNICKENDISHYHGKNRFTKAEMIEAILSIESNTKETPEEIDRTKYIDDAEIGTIVAFFDERGKARTAAIKSKDSNNKFIDVETEFGRQFRVPYDKVLWVKKGVRFPRGVYNLLKGIKDGNK